MPPFLHIIIAELCAKYKAVIPNQIVSFLLTVFGIFIFGSVDCHNNSMEQGLVYQPPKWEKELSNKAKVWKKQDGKISAYYNMMALLTRNEQKDSAQRNYCGIYSNLHLKYHIIAGNLYLKNPNDIQCVTYCYLSGLAGIFAFSICRIDVTEIKLPFYEDTVNALSDLPGFGRRWIWDGSLNKIDQGSK